MLTTVLVLEVGGPMESHAQILGDSLFQSISLYLLFLWYKQQKVKFDKIFMELYGR